MEGRKRHRAETQIDMNDPYQKFLLTKNQNMSRSGKSSAIVVFDNSQNNGDMITLGKRGKKYMNQVKESGNMGTGGGTL